MKAVNLKEKLTKFEEHWSPKILGELNGQHVKIAKLKGEFIWHHHEHEDELFYVIEGDLEIQFRDRTIQLGAGEFIIVPRGVEHKPVAKEEVSILLFEPASTINTGETANQHTKTNLEWI